MNRTVSEPFMWVGDSPSMFYPVMVEIPGEKEGTVSYMWGHIVTHLSLTDYCEMHGMRLVELFLGKREALEGEKTKLLPP